MLRLNNLKTRTAINAKILVFAICVEAIMYLVLHNLHDCTFNCNNTLINLKKDLVLNIRTFR